MIPTLYLDDQTMGDGVTGGIGGGFNPGGSSGGTFAPGGVSGGAYGQVGGGGIGGSFNPGSLREFIVEVQGTFTGIIGAAIPALGVYQNYNVTSSIRAALEDRGFMVQQVSDVGLGSGGRKFRITLLVIDGWSDSDVRSSVANTLANIMQVNKVSVASTPPGGSVWGGSTGGNYGGGGAGNNDGISLDWNNLLTGVGISTPVVIVGGALVLLLILRK